MALKQVQPQPPKTSMARRLTQSLFNTCSFLTILFAFVSIGTIFFSLIATFLLLVGAVGMGGLAGWMVYIADQNDWE